MPSSLKVYVGLVYVILVINKHIYMVTHTKNGTCMLYVDCACLINCGFGNDCHQSLVSSEKGRSGSIFD